MRPPFSRPLPRPAEEPAPEQPKRFVRGESETIPYKPQKARTLRHHLYDFMKDGRFRSAYELEKHPFLNYGRWVRAMSELAEGNFFFDRVSSSVRLRERRPGDARTVMQLLIGVDTDVREDVNPLRSGEALDADNRVVRYVVEEQVEEERVSLEDIGFNPETSDTSVVPTIPEADRMNVGKGDDPLVLSAGQYLTSTVGILARRGFGKTYFAMVVAEELCRIGHLFCVVDPTGVWTGLRSLADGSASSFEILTVGGTYKHFRLKDGATVAAAVIASPVPTIIDISALEPHRQHGFVADFGAAIFMKNTTARHIFVDEADEFAPQRIDSSDREQKRSLKVLDRLVRRGRKRGLGLTLITQRPAVISKNLLSQVDSLVVLNMVAPPDIEQVLSWMMRVATKRDLKVCSDNLPRLGKGKAFYMMAGESYFFRPFDVRTKTTYDSSATPIAGQPVPPPPSDLSGLSTRTMEAVEHFFVKTEARVDGGDGDTVDEVAEGWGSDLNELQDSDESLSLEDSDSSEDS